MVDECMVDGSRADAKAGEAVDGSVVGDVAAMPNTGSFG